MSEQLSSEKKLRKAHYEQMLAYAEDMECPTFPEETKWHYGNKRQFEKRHREIVEWLTKQTR
jgi:hypothetical protein